MFLPNVSLRIGFTGTSGFVTRKQKEKLGLVLQELHSNNIIALHGDCIGADALFDTLAHVLQIPVHIYPPKNSNQRAFCESYTYIHEPLDYLDRNTLIAENCDVLIAIPAQEKEVLRSGTWSTIRRARRFKKQIMIITPNGSVCYE